MKRIRFCRRGLTTGVVAVTALTAAGGIAYATIPDSGKVFNACMLNKVGTIRLIDKSLPDSNLMSHCTSLETPVSWNQQGQPGPAGAQGQPGTPGKDGANGKDGVSVASASLPFGDANCLTGGSKYTSASGDTYACNGAKGDTGAQGPQGPPGGTNYKFSELAPPPPGGAATPVEVFSLAALAKLDWYCGSMAGPVLTFTNISTAAITIYELTSSSYGVVRTLNATDTWSTNGVQHRLYLFDGSTALEPNLAIVRIEALASGSAFSGWTSCAVSAEWGV